MQICQQRALYPTGVIARDAQLNYVAAAYFSGTRYCLLSLRALRVLGSVNQGFEIYCFSA